MNPIVKKIVNDAVELAKENATSIIKELSIDDIRQLVKAELNTIIAPLQDEINTTSSLWVKIRNRMYITVLKNSTNTIISAVQKKIQSL